MLGQCFECEFYLPPHFETGRVAAERIAIATSDTISLPHRLPQIAENDQSFWKNRLLTSSADTTHIRSIRMVRTDPLMPLQARANVCVGTGISTLRPLASK
jgi:hypothetical protein